MGHPITACIAEFAPEHGQVYSLGLTCSLLMERSFQPAAQRREHPGIHAVKGRAAPAVPRVASLSVQSALGNCIPQAPGIPPSPLLQPPQQVLPLPYICYVTDICFVRKKCSKNRRDRRLGSCVIAQTCRTRSLKLHEAIVTRSLSLTGSKYAWATPHSQKIRVINRGVILF